MPGVKKVGEINIPLEIRKELDVLPISTHRAYFTKEHDDIIAYCRTVKPEKSFKGISDYLLKKFDKKTCENTVRKRWADIKKNYGVTSD